MRNVSKFAKCTPVFCGDDEIISKQRIHGRDIPSLISCIPFVLECKNCGRHNLGLFYAATESKAQTASAATTKSKILIFMS